MKIAFVGGGNMAQALIIGLKNQGFAMSDISVIELDALKREKLSVNLGVNTTVDLDCIQTSEVIVLAIKPQELSSVAKQIAHLLHSQLVVSIAAGVQSSDLSRWLGSYNNVIRAMPNTPAQIQAGITGLYAMPSVSRAHIAMADSILGAVGNTLWLDVEEKLDAVTAISGSGPAYVFYFIESLHDAALALGLNDEQARALSLATFKGASLLADQSCESITTLRAQVTSKNGTTEQGLISLESSKVKQAIILAAQKAKERARSLGDELARADIIQL